MGIWLEVVFDIPACTQPENCLERWILNRFPVCRCGNALFSPDQVNFTRNITRYLFNSDIEKIQWIHQKICIRFNPECIATGYLGKTTNLKISTL